MDSTRTREHRRCLENTEIFPTDQVNDKFGNRTQKGSVQVRLFGQDLFRAPDSGISYNQDHRTQWAGDDGEEKDSGHPMGSQLMGRKRRAGDWFAPSPCEDSMTSGRDVVEALDYRPPGDGYPVISQSGLFIESDSLKAAWSPGRKLEDTVAQLQRVIEEYRKELRIAEGQGPANPSRPTKRSGFTSTPVPRYSGKSSWEQYRQVFVAIACSNGWSPTTAALQLFAHLDGEALNVALLMPVEEREQWTVLARGLSSYFNSPGRLAAVRRRFESASRCQGVDLATFATELGILAVRGFGNMGERARGLMVRNKFIAAQQALSQALRQHLDGVYVEASIGDIVDSCQVWESHAEPGVIDKTGYSLTPFPRWRREPSLNWGRWLRTRCRRTRDGYCQCRHCRPWG